MQSLKGCVGFIFLVAGMVSLIFSLCKLPHPDPMVLLGEGIVLVLLAGYLLLNDAITNP